MIQGSSGVPSPEKAGVKVKQNVRMITARIRINLLQIK
jgi:hypothetical protein